MNSKRDFHSLWECQCIYETGGWALVGFPRSFGCTSYHRVASSPHVVVLIITHWEKQMVQTSLAFNLTTKWTWSFPHGFLSVFDASKQICSGSMTQPLRQPWQLLSTCISGPLNLTTKIKPWPLLQMDTYSVFDGDSWWWKCWPVTIVRLHVECLLLLFLYVWEVAIRGSWR